MNEQIGFYGEVEIYVIEGEIDQARAEAVLGGCDDPAIVAHILSANLITNTGRLAMTDRLVIAASTYSRPSYIGFTTSGTTPAVTDTALPGSEIGRSALGTIQRYNTYYQRYSATSSLTTFFSTGIMGIGLFSSSSGGEMWAEVSAAVSKTSTQSLVTQWLIQTLTP